MKVVIPGGSGQVGTILARAFHQDGHDVVVLSRQPVVRPWRVVAWDGRSPGAWREALDGCDVVINLAGRSVNCRYTATNRAELLRSSGLTLLTPSAAVDTNQFVANAETARRFDLTTMSSLAPVAGQLTFGGPPECPQRPFCLQGLHEVYGVLFDDFTPLDAGGPLTVDALKRDAVQIGLLFATDPSIEQNGFVPLLDDKRLQDAENITPVIRSEVLDDEVRSLLDAVSATLTSKEMTRLVGQVVIDGQDVADVAQGFLTQNRLL